MDEYRADIKVRNEATRRASANVGFKVHVDNNNFDVEIENRLARASRAVCANREMLSCRSVPQDKEETSGIQVGCGYSDGVVCRILGPEKIAA